MPEPVFTTASETYLQAAKDQVDRLASELATKQAVLRRVNMIAEDGAGDREIAALLIAGGFEVRTTRG